MTSLKVLITAASRRVPLIRAFQDALRELSVPGSVLVTDVNGLSPGVHVADRAFRVPLATEPGYMEAVEDICVSERVRLVIPTIDDELPLFGAWRTRLGDVGVRVAASTRLVAEICNDKFLTSHYLAAQGVPVAETFIRRHSLPTWRFRCSSSPASVAAVSGRLLPVHAVSLNSFLSTSIARSFKGSSTGLSSRSMC